MHLRAPSIDQGVHSFVWSVVFFLYMWLGSLAIGVSGGIALVSRSSRRRRSSSSCARAAESLVLRGRARLDAGRQRRFESGLSLSAATSRSAKSRPIASSRRASAGCFGVLVPGGALTSSRIRCEAAGATCVSTAALMERASAPTTGRRSLAGVNPVSRLPTHALVVERHSDGAAPRSDVQTPRLDQYLTSE